MTYWLINLPFLALAAVVAGLAWGRGRKVQAAPWLVAVVVMMVLTAIFDNAIIGFGLVDYDDALISGIRVGFAPLEDFAYTLAAVMIIPSLWHLFEPREKDTL
jgi:lycopene cyclase domain-containing protein